MDRVASPLRLMGADISLRADRFAPMEIVGAELSGVRYELPVASAQVKSCVLLAGLLASGTTTVVESIPSRDHSERVLSRAGATIICDQGGAGERELTIEHCDRLALDHITVPGDISSAAYSLVAASLLGGSELILRGVGVNWTRSGLLMVMRRMGARVEGELEQRSSVVTASWLNPRCRRMASLTRDAPLT